MVYTFLYFYRIFKDQNFFVVFGVTILVSMKQCHLCLELKSLDAQQRRKSCLMWAKWQKDTRTSEKKSQKVSKGDFKYTRIRSSLFCMSHHKWRPFDRLRLFNTEFDLDTSNGVFNTKTLYCDSCRSRSTSDRLSQN